MKRSIAALLLVALGGCGSPPVYPCPAVHLRLHDAVSGLPVGDAKVVLSLDRGRIELEATDDTVMIRRYPEPGEYILAVNGPNVEVIVSHPAYVTQRVSTAPYSDCTVFGDAAQSPYWSDRWERGVRLTAMDVWLVRR